VKTQKSDVFIFYFFKFTHLSHDRWERNMVTRISYFPSQVCLDKLPNRKFPNPVRYPRIRVGAKKGQHGLACFEVNSHDHQDCLPDLDGIDSLGFILFRTFVIVDFVYVVGVSFTDTDVRVAFTWFEVLVNAVQRSSVSVELHLR